MMDLASANAKNIPMDRRAADEYALFGAQGGGGFALLSDPAVREQVLVAAQGNGLGRIQKPLWLVPVEL